MRYCTACGHPNPDEATTCSRCEASLGFACLACGQTMLPGSRFCSHCGARLSASPLPQAAELSDPRGLESLRALMPQSLAEKIGAAAPGIVGERREATVLFADMVDLHAATQGLDSEGIYLLKDEVLRLLAEVVYKYEGTIDKYTSGGLKALFGVPVAHENDPERAVRAALQMQEALRPLQERTKEEHKLDLRLCIGINTGLVIAGQTGNDLHLEYTVIGDTVHMANRLKDAAEPGTVAVSFSTYRRTRPLFEYKPLPVQAGGEELQSVRGFRPVGQRETPGQVRGLPGLHVPMIGRREGLAQLQDTLGQVRRNHQTHVVFITGEPGVGKSRLVAEFRKFLNPPNTSFYQGNCLTYARSKPLLLLADLLRSITNVSESAPADVQREALIAYLQTVGLANDEVLPYLTDVLTLRQTESRLEARMRLLDGAVRQKLIHAALRQVLLAEGQLAPTVLVFEDLHWIDQASKTFLEYLIQTLDHSPLMLIIVSRAAERQTVLGPLMAAAETLPQRFVDIRVRPLSSPEGQLLVEHLMQQTGDDGEQIKNRIAERAEGNPFYAEEIVRMLLDQGGLVRKDGTYQVTPAADELLRKVPGTLAGLIQARMDRLPVTLRRTLQTTAVLGSVFPEQLLERVAGLTARDTAAHLAELESRQFLSAMSKGTVQGYRFSHALIQEVVYGTLLTRDRQALHEQAARTIEEATFWLPDEQTEALAHHYAHSSSPSKALPHLITAAENAARRCANETAIQRYRQVLALIDSGTAVDGDLLLRIRMGLGQALKFVGEYAEASQTLKSALRYLLEPSVMALSSAALPMWVQGMRELADIYAREGAPGEASAFLQAGLDLLGDEGAEMHPHLWRSVIERLAWVRFRQGELDEAYQLAQSAVLSLDPEGADDPITLASLHNTLGGISWQRGNLSEATGYVEHSLDLYQQLGYLWGMANASNNLGILHYRLGNWPKALESWGHSLSLYEGMGDVQHQAFGLNNLGFVKASMGKHEEAKADLENGLRLGRQLGDDWIIAQSLASLAQLALACSDFQEAARRAEAALPLAEAIASSEVAVQARWILALAQAESGSVDVALESAEQALQLAREAGLQDLVADCLRVLGILRIRTGEWLEAETHFHESIELCLQQEDPFRHGQALLEMGRMYQNLAHAGDLTGTGWQSRALDLLEQAADQFRQLGAAHDLQTTQKILQAIQAEMAPEGLGRLPRGAWHKATIIWLGFVPTPEANDEAIFEALTRVLPTLTAIAGEYQGQVVRRQDGMTVVFGAPVAFEDDAERAVQAASRMVHHVAQTEHQTGSELACTVVVSQGGVVAGQIDTPFHSEFRVEGAPVDRAQRAADIVPPGTVWVTDAVRVATQRLFEYEPAPSSVAMRLDDLPLLRLVSPRERPAPTRGLPGMEAKFIGRESALGRMRDLSSNWQEGLGGLIWIEGEPGIGKSRLMREFTALLAADEPLIWRAKCTPQNTNHAFALFIDLMAQALNVQPSDSADQILARIDRSIHRWPRDAQATRPYLEILLGVQPSGFVGERLIGLQPEQLQRQIFVALRRFFKSMASSRSLALVMDDLHWIDPISAELLHFLLTMVTSDPVLFVCAQRRQGADLPNDRLVRAQSLIPTHTVRLRLERLSHVESEMLLTELLSDSELPAQLTTIVLERSQGNPFFIEEYVRMLIEQDHLRQRQGRWELDPELDPEALPLPSSLETLVRSRIDALPAELGQLLQYAAIIGSPFEARVLESIPGLAQVRANLRRLESRQLLQQASEADQWSSHHSVIEKVVHNAMLKARRRALHGEVAQALEASWVGAEDEHAHELAHHFTLAGEVSKALPYLILAGEQGAARYANEEAASYFEEASRHLRAQPDAAGDLRWRLAVGQGDVYRAMGRFSDSMAALRTGLDLIQVESLSQIQQAGLYRRMGETAQKQGDLDEAYGHLSQTLAILGAPGDREAQTEAAHALTRLAWNHFLQGDFDQARQTCEQSLASAKQAGILSQLAFAENLLGGIHYQQSEWRLALQHTTRAMILREQMGFTWGVASTLNNLGILAVMAGQWSKASSFFERSLGLRQEVGDVEGVAITYNNLGMLARDQGKLDLAESYFRQSLAVAMPFEMTFHATTSNMGLAQALLRKGQSEEAGQVITASLKEAQALGARDLLAEIHQIQAEILLAQCAWDEAREMAQQSASLAAEIRNRSLEASAWRLIAETELERDDAQGACQALRTAQDILADVTDELLAGRVSALAGRISLHEGQWEQAEQDLRVAREILSRLGASLDLREVQDVLRHLSRAESVDIRKLISE